MRRWRSPHGHYLQTSFHHGSLRAAGSEGEALVRSRKARSTALGRKPSFTIAPIDPAQLMAAGQSPPVSAATVAASRAFPRRSSCEPSQRQSRFWPGAGLPPDSGDAMMTFARVTQRHATARCVGRHRLRDAESASLLGQRGEPRPRSGPSGHDSSFTVSRGGRCQSVLLTHADCCPELRPELPTCLTRRVWNAAKNA